MIERVHASATAMTHRRGTPLARPCAMRLPPHPETLIGHPGPGPAPPAKPVRMALDDTLDGRLYAVDATGNLDGAVRHGHGAGSSAEAVLPPGTVIGGN